MYFQSFLEWLIGFMSFNTPKLYLCWKWNWRNWRLQFWSDLVNLEKSSVSSKDVFHAIAQMFFQSSIECFACLKAYDTNCMHFYQISNPKNYRLLFWSGRVTLLEVLLFAKDIFHGYRSNIFSKFLRMVHRFFGLW